MTSSRFAGGSTTCGRTVGCSGRESRPCGTTRPRRRSARSFGGSSRCRSARGEVGIGGRGRAVRGLRLVEIAATVSASARRARAGAELGSAATRPLAASRASCHLSSSKSFRGPGDRIGGAVGTGTGGVFGAGSAASATRRAHASTTHAPATRRPPGHRVMRIGSAPGEEERGRSERAPRWKKVRSAAAASISARISRAVPAR